MSQLAQRIPKYGHGCATSDQYISLLVKCSFSTLHGLMSSLYSSCKVLGIERVSGMLLLQLVSTPFGCSSLSVLWKFVQVLLKVYSRFKACYTFALHVGLLHVCSWFPLALSSFTCDLLIGTLQDCCWYACVLFDVHLCFV